MSYELPEDAKEELEDQIVKAMAQARVPGASIALVKDDEVVYAKGFGARNLKENAPATPHTLYGIGSCTKSFTALAVMQLVEEGKLDVQDPMKKYVPLKLGYEETPIRINHLLTHSSGVPSLGVANILIGKMTGVDEYWIPMSTFEDFLLYINGASKEVAAEPGKRYFYFNTGYTLLGEIVERVSEMSYEDYIKEKILKPLEMNRSTFLKEDFERDPDTMTAYRKSRDGSIVATVHPFHKLVYAPGGLLSSVVECANYLTMNMSGGVFEGKRLVDASLMEEVHKIHFERSTGHFGRQRYGYGWSITEGFLGHKLVQHSGSTGVSSALLAFIPDKKIGVALASNTGGFGSLRIVQVALAHLLGKDPEKEIPSLEIEKRLNMLEGKYESYRGIYRVSVVKRGSLLYLVRGQEEVGTPLIPESDKIEDLKFYIYSVEARTPVEFEVDREGRAHLYLDRWSLHKVKG
ncbi:MAG: serine hydrolase [Candidatus Bathyarchaeia archaeon]